MGGTLKKAVVVLVSQLRCPGCGVCSLPFLTLAGHLFPQNEAACGGLWLLPHMDAASTWTGDSQEVKLKNIFLVRREGHLLKSSKKTILCLICYIAMQEQGLYKVKSNVAVLIHE